MLHIFFLLLVEQDKQLVLLQVTRHQIYIWACCNKTRQPVGHTHSYVSSVFLVVLHFHDSRLGAGSLVDETRKCKCVSFYLLAIGVTPGQFSCIYLGDGVGYW